MLAGTSEGSSPKPETKVMRIEFAWGSAGGQSWFQARTIPGGKLRSSTW